MTQQPHSQYDSMIEIRPKHIFLAFLFIFFSPYYSINGGQPIVGKWKHNEVPLPAGRYRVDVWVKYLLWPQMGRSSIVVDAPRGFVAEVTWRAPLTVFGSGKIQLAGTRPLPGGAPHAQRSAQQPAPSVWGEPTATGGPGPTSTTQGHGPGWGGRQQPSPAAWHRDPTGRHEMRYFDGARWTEHVSDRGGAGRDPLAS